MPKVRAFVGTQTAASFFDEVAARGRDGAALRYLHDGVHPKELAYVELRARIPQWKGCSHPDHCAAPERSCRCRATLIAPWLALRPSRVGNDSLLLLLRAGAEASRSLDGA